MRVSPAKRYLESPISTEESWPSIQPLGFNTRGMAMSCRVAYTVAREELGAARNSPDCAPYCSTIAVSSCKDRPIALPICRDRVSTPLPYIHNSPPPDVGPKACALARWIVALRYCAIPVLQRIIWFCALAPNQRKQQPPRRQSSCNQSEPK